MPAKKAQIEAKFDKIFTVDTAYLELNKALKATHNHRQHLLAVLDHPYIPLHNNISERDIREVAKKRKISAGSRIPMKRADEALCRGGGRISVKSCTSAPVKGASGRISINSADEASCRGGGGC